MKGDIITDVAIAELSLVFGEKGGKKYAPRNPDAVILATKAGEVTRPSLLGKYESELTQKASDAQGEAEVSVAYSTITSVLYTAIDDLWCISYAPDSFSVEARKDAIKTVIDNMLKSIKDASAVVLKAGEVDVIAQPPFQAPPGDHPHLPKPIENVPPLGNPTEIVEPSSPPAEPTIAPEVEDPPKPKTDEKPEDKPADKPNDKLGDEKDEKAKQIEALQAQVATLADTVKAQTEQLTTATTKAAAAEQQVKALIVTAKEPTPNASTPRALQETEKAGGGLLNGNAPNAALFGANSILESAIMAQLSG